ncbi:MAG: polysaccharide biosynthesis C-terminal domain-containing protein, partial [Verrucomicrobia bacterium]|nr:polysaccharide biosynthesis C-terminal domain-containing protein [Verrucomicrobiota bacterium]
YALGDTATPMKISVVCLLMNLVFSIWLIFPFKQAGLGVANSITSFLNVALLIYAMKKKLKRLSFEGFTKNMVWLGLACILGGEVAWIAGRVWESNYGHATLMLQICGVFVPAAIGGVVYFISGLALGLSQPREFLGLAKRMVSKLFGG